MSKFTPTYIRSGIFELDKDFFEKEKINCVLLDIDNTLVADNDPYPDERARAFIKRLQSLGLGICLVSNNKKARVDSFNNEFGLKAVYRARKPLTRKLVKAINEMGYTKDETVFAGDQLLTDVLAGNMAGIRTILVNPINTGKENAFFHFKRFIEKQLFMREFE